MENAAGNVIVSVEKGWMRRWLSSLSALLLTTLSLVSIGALVPTHAARAADVPGAITSVSTTAPSVTNGSSFKLDFVWGVPDNTPEGDTFTIALPTELTSTGGEAFDLLAADGSAMANCAWVGQTATCTLTSFVTTQPLNITGTGFFGVTLNDPVANGTTTYLINGDVSLTIVVVTTVSVGVHKVVVGTPTVPMPEMYGATLTCTPPGGVPGDPVALTLPADGSVVSTQGIAVGSSCTADEPSPPADATVTYAPGATFTVGPHGVIVTVTNTFVPATVSVNIHKAIVGSPSVPAPQSYAATVTCTPPGGIPGDPVAVTLPADGSVVSTPGIAVGSSCTLDEPAPPVGATVTYEPGATFTVGPQGADATVVNSFGPDTVTVGIHKAVVGTPPTPAPDSYAATLTCTPPIGIPTEPVIVVLPADGTVVSTPSIEVGSSCTIEESSPPAGATVTYEPGATFDAGPQGADVTIVNTFPPATATIGMHKTVEGTPPTPVPDSYAATVTCTPPGGTPSDPVMVALPADGTVVSTAGIAVGSSCTIDEPNPPAGAIVTFDPGATFVVGTNGIDVIVKNYFGPATVTVSSHKAVVGTPPTPVPDSYAVTLTCAPPVGIPGQPVVVSLPADGTVVSTPGIAVGSSCTIDEPNPPAGATVTYEPGATFVAGPQGADVTVVNTFAPATATVGTHKAVVGMPPTPVPDSFAVTVTCTPPGGTPGESVVVSLPVDGTVVSTPGIVVGSSCTVDEPSPPAGATVTYAPSATFTVGPHGAIVTVTNTFGPPTVSVNINKAINGTPPVPVPESYGATLTCTPPLGVPGQPVALTLPADGSVVSTPGIAVGSSCTVEEPMPPAGATVTYQPGATFTVGPQGANATILNSYAPTTVSATLHKSVVGTPPVPIPESYGATLTCTPPVGVPGKPVVVTLPADGSVVSTPGIAVGSFCIVDEPMPPAGATVTYEPGATFVAGPQGANVTIVNTFVTPTVSVNVHKSVVGTPPVPVPDSYGATLTCTPPGGTPTGPVALTLPADGSLVSTLGIAVGSSCTIDEPNPPSGAMVTYDPGATFVAGPQGTHVTVFNSFVPSTVSVNVHKSVVGTPPVPVPDSYGATLTCTPPGGTPTDPVVLTLPADGTVVSTLGIAVGSSCTVNEPTPAGATVTYEPGATFTVGPQCAHVTIVNTYPTVIPTTPVKLHTAVQGFPPEPAPSGYVVMVTCTPGAGGPAVTYPVELPADGTPVVQQVTSGSMCGVVESTPPPNATVSYSPATFLAGDSPVTVAVANYYAPRKIFVTNVVVEGMPPLPPSTSSLVSLTCTAPSGGPVASETLALGPNSAALSTGFFSLGSTCTLQALNPPAGASVSYEPSQSFVFLPETSVKVITTVAR